MPVKVEAIPMLPGLSPVRGKAIVARFDGACMSSDGGLLALREVEQRLAIASRLAACIHDPRDPSRIIHGLDEIVRTRLLMIAAGYEDGNDADSLRRVWRDAERLGHLQARPALQGQQDRARTVRLAPHVRPRQRAQLSFLLSARNQRRPTRHGSHPAYVNNDPILSSVRAAGEACLGRSRCHAWSLHRVSANMDWTDGKLVALCGET